MHATLLKPMFSTVADTYDLVNKILTFGWDERWRKACITEVATGRVIVDLCCGTGALSLSLLSKIKSDSFLLGLDFSKEMLSKAVLKCKRYKKFDKQFEFVIADAAHLPLKKRSIDDMRISFSFRNLIFKNPKALTYLKEAVNVLTSNGRFTCVETSQPENYLLRRLFHIYCLNFVSFVGGFLSGHKPAYRYLGMSAASFPIPKEILSLMKKAGFAESIFKPLSLGVVGLYMGIKKHDPS